MKTKCKHVKILMTRKTNKVANELNKLGVGKKKLNLTEKKATLPTGERSRWRGGGGRAVGFIKIKKKKRKKNTQKHD